MIKVVIAVCLSLVAWFYSILRYYDWWKRGKVPVVFFAFLHIVSIVIIAAFESGLLARASDVLSVCGYAYELIYGSVMILTPVFCFLRGGVRYIGKKAGCNGKVYRFFNHPTKLIIVFFVITFLLGIGFFINSRIVRDEQIMILCRCRRTWAGGRRSAQWRKPSEQCS